MKCVCYFFVLVYLAVLPLSAQTVCDGAGTWLPVGAVAETASLYPYRATGMNGQLYMMALDEGRFGFVITNWTGTVWQEVGFLPHGQYEPSYMAPYNDELYVSTVSGYGQPGGGEVLKLKDGEWESVGEFDGGNRITQMVDYGGKLVVAGNFTRMANTTTNSIAAWDGSEWDNLGGGFSGPGMENAVCTINSLAVKGDVLYVSGYFESPTSSANFVAAWDGSTWATVNIRPSWAIENLVVYDDNLYAYCNNTQSVVVWVGGPWLEVSPRIIFSSESVGPRLIVFNDKLYVCGINGLWEADGEIVATSCERYDGSRWERVSGFERPAIVQFLQEVQGVLYAGGQFYRGCNNIWDIARFCDDATCGAISGSVFYDLDGDCQWEDTDRTAAGRTIQVQPGGYYAQTDVHGRYTVTLPMGSYTVSAAPRNYWQVGCPTSATRSVTVSEEERNIADQYFGFVAEQEVEALEVSVVAGLARPGRDVVYSIHCENVGTLPFSGVVQLEYDPLLTYKSSTAAEQSHTGQKLEWRIDNMPVAATKDIQVIFRVLPDGSVIGTEICAQVQAKADEHADPLEEERSRDEYCRIITGGIDPNKIAVSPRGAEPNGAITEKDSVLYYTIHFQNTGTDTAFKVVIIDKIRAELDLSTLRVGASSHPFHLDITSNNELRWVFPDIELPDSNASEPNSHGYVKYSVQLKKGLSDGTRILNDAAIYFDYNDAVQTNTVQNTLTPSPATSVDESSESAPSVYPNPVGDCVTISSPALVPGAITVYNSLGRAVLVAANTKTGRADIRVNTLPPGVYQLVYPTAGRAMSQTFTIVR